MMLQMPFDTHLHNFIKISIIIWARAVSLNFSPFYDSTQSGYILCKYLQNTQEFYED